MNSFGPRFAVLKITLSDISKTSRGIINPHNLIDCNTDKYVILNNFVRSALTDIVEDRQFL